MNESVPLELYPRPDSIERAKGTRFSIPRRMSVEFKTRLTRACQKDISKALHDYVENGMRAGVAETGAGAGTWCVSICDGRGKQGQYTVRIEPACVKIAGSDEDAIRQGVHTFLEILRNSERAGRLTPITVKDSPFVPVRAVHLFLPAREDIPFYKRFVSRFLAPLHYNAIFLEVGGGMRFDRHPRINKGWKRFAEWVFKHRSRPIGPGGRFQDSAHAEVGGGAFLEKDEVANLVEWTRSWGLEVIPEIQSLTHSYYLTAGYREISELPEATWPDAYCASNPKSYDVLFDVMEEYIEVMKPGTVHIGHDEWREPALCRKCIGKVPELFAKDVCRIHDFLDARNIRTAMWADGLLQEGDGRATYTCIDSIPSDILLLHWYWSLDRRFYERLCPLGFQMILGNFLPSIDEDEWKSLTAQPEILGAEISSWVGMNQDRFAIDGIVWQMLTGANLLWNGKKLSLDERYRLASDCLPGIVNRLSNKPSVSSSESFKDVSVDITPCLNAPPVVNDAGDGVQWNVSSLCPGKHEWKGIGCEIVNPWEHGGRRGRIGVAVSRSKTSVKQGKLGKEVGFEKHGGDKGSFSFPEKVAVKLGRRAKGLVFFHFASKAGKHLRTCDLRNPHEASELIGCYLVHYQSGVKETIEIHYGLNIASPKTFVGGEGGNPPLLAPPAIRIDNGSSMTGEAVWALEWQNPKPRDKILCVEMRSAKTESGAFPVLFGLNILS